MTARLFSSKTLQRGQRFTTALTLKQRSCTSGRNATIVPVPVPTSLADIPVPRFAKEAGALVIAVTASSLFLSDSTLLKSYHATCQSSRDSRGSNISTGRIQRPPTFGSSIQNQRRLFHTLSQKEDLSQVIQQEKKRNDERSDIGKNNREDCPICERYSQGPCGSIFKTWLQCTDDHPGQDPKTGKDLHLDHCAKYASSLASCLEKNESFYENLKFEQMAQETAKVDPKEHEELQQAWERLIQEDLQDIPRVDFSKHDPGKPIMEIRPLDRTGVIMVPINRIDKSNKSQGTDSTLLLVFVQDSTTHQLLSAGSLEDVFRYTPSAENEREKGELGVLQFIIPETTTEIVASVLYEPTQPPSTANGSRDDHVILTHRARVPTRKSS